ncbi:cupin domain-containing protein [uncultured Roseobacter sp.]|uniref:cupin domain-containing protein n=1 Tax=uncultured Roseobacter sp. TaxID=114847 RepID=UPI002629FDC8|nr:cupin domain-containing protein [uncultured Roseobacter sp.]
MTVISTETASHYLWQQVCDGWPLVDHPGLSVKQERMPPGKAEDRHHHTLSRQFFYVLAGELTMELDGTRHAISANQGIEVAPGLSHQARNDSPGPVDFLVVSSPSAADDRILENR